MKNFKIFKSMGFVVKTAFLVSALLAISCSSDSSDTDTSESSIGDLLSNRNNPTQEVPENTTGMDNSNNNGNAVVLTDADFQASTDYCNEKQAIHRQNGYVYELWQADTEGETCMKINEDGDFFVEWSNINNILSRKGKRPGTKNDVIEYSVQNTSVGNVFFGAYGWWRDTTKAGTINEIVEYYVVENHSDVYRPSDGGQLVETYMVDGALYELFVIQVFNRPNVYSSGNDDFIQLKSIRVENSLRDSGTITMKSHFDAWERAGYPVSNLFEVSMKIEGFAFRPTRNEAKAYLKVDINTP